MFCLQGDIILPQGGSINVYCNKFHAEFSFTVWTENPGSIQSYIVAGIKASDMIEFCGFLFGVLARTTPAWVLLDRLQEDDIKVDGEKNQQNFGKLLEILRNQQ